MTKGAEKTGKERRRSARYGVLETFHVFLVIPRAGLRKIYLNDVSEGGLGFQAEADDIFRAEDILDVSFYINPNLRLPLKIKILHVTNDVSGMRIGCAFAENSSKAYKAFVDFIRLLDTFSEFIE